MNQILRDKLLEIIQEKQTKIDPSHDIQHVLRVMNLAEKIAATVGADLDIVLAAACFHDVIVYSKDSPQSKTETDESAELAGEILAALEEFPAKKIEQVQSAIRQCSFSKGIVPEELEAKVLQDADRLDATGAIAIMRTFSSGGQMNRPFYDPSDPFCEQRIPLPIENDLTLFYVRLLVVERGIHTDYARQIAKRRTEFLRAFLDECRIELKEAGVLE